MTIAAGSSALAADLLNTLNSDGTLKSSIVAEANLTLADNTTADVSITAHGFVPKAPNDTAKFLRGDATWAVARIVQVVNTQTGAMATGTTAIPGDNTKPQITEGDQYMTLEITPTSATNKLLVDVVWIGTNTNAGVYLIVALFQDSTADALACGLARPGAGGYVETIHFTHYMTAGTTSATTFKVRAGGDTGATTTFNGSAGTALYNGTLASSITITEIAA